MLLRGGSVSDAVIWTSCPHNVMRAAVHVALAGVINGGTSCAGFQQRDFDYTLASLSLTFYSIHSNNFPSAPLLYLAECHRCYKKQVTNLHHATQIWLLTSHIRIVESFHASLSSLSKSIPMTGVPPVGNQQRLVSSHHLCCYLQRSRSIVPNPSDRFHSLDSGAFHLLSRLAALARLFGRTP